MSMPTTNEVLVLNVDGYIGESTRREIEYATARNKPVYACAVHVGGGD